MQQDLHNFPINNFFAVEQKQYLQVLISNLTFCSFGQMTVHLAHSFTGIKTISAISEINFCNNIMEAIFHFSLQLQTIFLNVS